jgi:hypothetical protein
MNTDNAHYVEVALPNGTLVTKKTSRNYTHAIVSGDEVISWHTGENAAHRAYYRLATRSAEPLHIERTRVA